MAHQGPPNPLHHVQDNSVFHFFDTLFGAPELALPAVKVFGYPVQITKFMVLEVVAAALIILIYVPICRQARSGALPRGRWWNAFEAVLTFLRNEVVRPNFPAGKGDAYLPFFWTIFLFILFCNLLGMIPFLGSPTSSIWVTAGLAVCAFFMIHGVSIARVGLMAYLKSMWLPIDARYIGPVISVLLFVLEFVGSFIKSAVLAVRLFANMFAGHMVLAYILAFIWAANWTLLWPVVTFASVVGMVALSMLELFVAFLQAYVFTFLTALFVGMALEHAEHASHADGHAKQEHEPGHAPDPAHHH